MPVYDFDHAIVREPGRSVVRGLRSDRSAIPNFENLLAEHRSYVGALRAAGLAVDILPPLEAYPDSIFVEDPALVFREGAILLRPGAPSRTGEREAIRAALARHFDRVLELEEDAFADGGDILTTPDMVFIGLSQRTDRAGAEALVSKLASLGRKALIAQTRPSVLHFKTAVSLIDEETLLVTRAMAEASPFEGFDLIVVPDGDEPAANALRVNDVVLMDAAFPRAIDLVAKRGLTIQPLSVTEIGKLDAGLSCMSLRW